MSMLHHLAPTLGYGYSLQDTIVDPFRAVVKQDGFEAIFQSSRFHPHHCSYVFSAWHQRCFHDHIYGLMARNHFEMYDDLVYNFLQDVYRPDLRRVAAEAHGAIVAQYPDRTLIGVLSRAEEIRDERVPRRLGVVDYEEMMAYYKGLYPNALFLVMGDKSVSAYRGRSDVLFLEEYMGGVDSSLVAQFTALDVSGRLPHHILNKFSNTFYLAMAFRRLNGNLAPVADVFSMQIYTYQQAVVTDLNQGGRFDAAFWTTRDSPYVTKDRGTMRHFQAFNQCWTDELVWARAHPREEEARRDSCQRQFLVEEGSHKP